jgi:hypothetical protein
LKSRESFIKMLSDIRENHKNYEPRAEGASCMKIFETPSKSRLKKKSTRMTYEDCWYDSRAVLREK